METNQINAQQTPAQTQTISPETTKSETINPAPAASHSSALSPTAPYETTPENTNPASYVSPNPPNTRPDAIPAAEPPVPTTTTAYHSLTPAPNPTPQPETSHAVAPEMLATTATTATTTTAYHSLTTAPAPTPQPETSHAVAPEMLATTATTATTTTAYHLLTPAPTPTPQPETSPAVAAELPATTATTATTTTAYHLLTPAPTPTPQPETSPAVAAELPAPTAQSALPVPPAKPESLTPAPRANTIFASPLSNTEASTTINPLYNPSEAEQIVRHLTADGLFDPEYILLFGSLAGGTPHSDAAAYDILVVTRQTPTHDWLHAKRQLRYKMPVSRREISYINVYVMTASYVKSHSTPFLYFAHSEGTLLYSRDISTFRRPKRYCDFAAAYADAKRYHDTFHTLGTQLLSIAKTHTDTPSKNHADALPKTHTANSGTPGNNIYNSTPSPDTRLSAYFAAQAASCFYRALYYVYHNHEFTPNDPAILHERTRTLSTELMLELDDTHTKSNATIPKLSRFLKNALQNPDFDFNPNELIQHIYQVKKIQNIINRKCKERLEIYKYNAQHKELIL